MFIFQAPVLKYGDFRGIETATNAKFQHSISKWKLATKAKFLAQHKFMQARPKLAKTFKWFINDNINRSAAEARPKLLLLNKYKVECCTRYLPSYRAVTLTFFT